MQEMPVEWGKIREYAVATGNERPEYMENPFAPIPPTFLATVIFWDEPGGGLRTPEAAAALEELGLEADIRNVLSAEQEYRFFGPLPRAGDRLYLSHRFDGVEVKHGRRGGQMIFTKFTVEFRDAVGQLRAECLYTSARTSQAATEESVRA
jgi:hypothetical protein